jgi:DNA-binding LacI/PurR family transcriptional regulator
VNSKESSSAMITSSARNLRKYELVREGLVAAIESGRFAAGERLPTVQALAEQHGVSVAPVVQAITSLCKEGLIARIPGQQGVFVAGLAGAVDRKVKAVAMVYEGAAHQPAGGASKLFPQIVVENIAEAARRQGVDVRIFAHRPVTIDKEDQELLQIISQFQVVVFPDANYHHWTKYLEAQGCRVLFVGTNNAYPGVNRLRFDLSGGVAEAVDHLVQLGHRRIAYLDSIEQYLGLPHDKTVGYCRGMSRHGLAATLLPLENGNQIGAYRAIAKVASTWSASNERPTAILAGNDLLAAGAMVALQEAGLRVPLDISVMGMDDRPDAAEATPPLTTIALDHPAITTLALEWITQSLDQGNALVLDKAVPMRLVIRESTAAAEHIKHR